MNYKLFYLFTFVLFFTSAVQAESNTIFMNDTHNVVTSAENIFYFEDKHQKLNFESAVELTSEEWALLPNNIANFGFSESTYWFSFDVSNNGPTDLGLYVHLDYALLDNIQFYSIENGNVDEYYQTGDSLSFKQRPIEYPTFLFPVELKENQTKRILLRVESTGSLQVPLSIWQKETFLLESRFFQFVYGGFLGVLVIMSIYNIFLYVLIRDWSYLFYAFFALSIAGINSSFDGFSYQWLWPNSPKWNQISVISFVSIAGISITLFTRMFLPLPKTGYIKQWVNILVFLSLLSGIISVFSPYRQAAVVSAFATLIVVSGIIIISVAMLKHNPRVARFYLLAWLTYFIGILLKAASKMGFIPYSFISEYSAHIGAISGAILLSLALADRINTERRGKEKAQQQAIGNLQRFHSLYENALEGIFSFDLKGNLLSANPAFLKVIGIDNFTSFKGDYQNMDGYVLKPTEFSALLRKVKRKGQVVDFETKMLNKQDAELWVNISARLSKNTDTGESHLEGTLININERKAFEEQLKHLAAHDPLTDFFNRRGFESNAKEKLEAVKSYKESCCLMYMDLDQFKIVNDLCGHTAGDMLLKKLSQHLLIQINNLGEGAIIARLGGDEFGILLSHTRLDKARLIAERVRQLVEDFLFVWEGKRYTLGVSIGLVELRPYHQSVEQLLVMADTACYLAKDQGRNRVHTFIETDKDLQFRQLEMQWVSSIKEAISKDQFFLVFQNIESNNSPNEQHHYEILLRLLNGDGNLCTPSQFLPAAERYNLMPNIDRWVVESYFSWLKDNPEHLRQLSCASLNLSTQSLGDEAFSDFLISLFVEYGIPHNKICFEITEGMAITHLDNTHSFITKFHNLGCRFALDDFGTGFSSYAYLKELQVDYLKIDGIFIKNLTKDSVDYAMVKSISDVAKAIGIETIAEFVESEDIRQKLIDIGITYSQGYHIHKPVTLDMSAFSVAEK